MMTVKWLKECGAKFCIEPPRRQQGALAPGRGGGGSCLGAAGCCGLIPSPSFCSSAEN